MITPYFAWPELLEVQASPTPTATTFTLDNAGNLVGADDDHAGQYILVQDGFDWERAQILSIAGNAVTLTAPLASGAPAAGAAVRNGRKLIINDDLDAAALFNAEDTDELEDIDTTYAKTGLKYQILGAIWYFDRSSAAAVSADVRQPNIGPGRWHRLTGEVDPSILGGRLLLVDPGHPDAGAGSLTKPYEFLQDAHTALTAGDTVLVAPGTYATGSGNNELSITKSSTWQGLGPVRLSNVQASHIGMGISIGDPYTTVITADEDDVRFDDFTFDLVYNAGFPAVLHAVEVQAYDGGAYLEFNRCRFLTDAVGYAFRARLMEDDAFLEATFNECYFEVTSSNYTGFMLEEGAFTGGTGTITFNRCVFKDFPRFNGTGHTIYLNDCTVIGASATPSWHGTIEINGGVLVATTAPNITSTASKTLALKARGVEFKSNAIGGEFLTMGAGSTFTFERQNCTVTGTATAINSGITVTTNDTGGSLADDSVTFAKMQEIGANTIIGNATGSTANPTAISCTPAGRALIDDADNTAQRQTLGLPVVQAMVPRAVGAFMEVTAQVLAGNTTALYWRIHVDAEIVVNSISLRLSASPGTPSTWDIVVFSEDGQTKLINVTSASLTTSGVTYATSVGGVRLPPGHYYMGLVANTSGTSTSFTAWNSSSAMAAAAAGKYALLATAAVTAGTIPATINPTSLTESFSTSPPIVRFDT